MPEDHKGSTHGAATARGQGPPSGARGQGLITKARSQGQIVSQSNSTAKANSSGQKGTSNGSEQYYTIASEILGQNENLEEVFINSARDGNYAKIENLLQRRNDMILSVDAKDRVTGNTALIWAAKRGHTKIVQLLLKHGADITLRNYEGLTAVEVASPQLRQQLLESVDKGGQHRNLLQAAWQGNAQLVKRILAENNRLDINCKNSDGLTPLLLVTRDAQLFERLGDRVVRNSYNPSQVVEELLTNRADPNAADEEGKTPLHHASSSKASSARDVVTLLLTSNSDIGAQDRRCFTPIHCASHSGNVEVVLALLEGGSDANARGFAGTTPLHISAINGHERVAATLLEQGADVTIVDDSGHTPVDVAKTKRVKNTLKQAWTEATQRKIERNLGPVRPPSRDSLRHSQEFRSPPAKRRNKAGEVIFDSLPASQSTNDGAFSPRKPPPILKRWTNSEITKPDIIKDIEETFSPLPREPTRGFGFRNHSPSRAPPSRGSSRNLTPLTGASPRVSGLPEIDVKQERVGSGGRKTMTKSATAPGALSKEMNVPVTILGLDLDENLQEVRVKKIFQSPVKSQRKSHRRNLSDPYPPSPVLPDPSDEFILRGRTPSKYVEEEDTGNTSRVPSGSDRTRLHTIEEDKVVKNLTQNTPIILNLDQMQLRNMHTPVADTSNYPTSKRLLPPTPTFITQTMEGSDVKLTDVSQDFDASSEECSEDESEDENDVKLAVSNPAELLRSKSLLKTGAFNIEDTRVMKDSGIESDQQNSGSNRSSINSSSSSQSISPRGLESQYISKKTVAAKVREAVSKSIPRQGSVERNSSTAASNQKTQNVINAENSTGKQATASTSGPAKSVSKQDINKSDPKMVVQPKVEPPRPLAVPAKSSGSGKPQSNPGVMLRNIAKDNAIKNPNSPSSVQAERANAKCSSGPSNKIIIHSDILTESKASVDADSAQSTNKVIVEKGSPCVLNNQGDKQGGIECKLSGTETTTDSNKSTNKKETASASENITKKAETSSAVSAAKAVGSSTVVKPAVAGSTCANSVSSLSKSALQNTRKSPRDSTQNRQQRISNIHVSKAAASTGQQSAAKPQQTSSKSASVTPRVQQSSAKQGSSIVSTNRAQPKPASVNKISAQGMQLGRNNLVKYGMTINDANSKDKGNVPQQKAGSDKSLKETTDSTNSTKTIAPSTQTKNLKVSSAADKVDEANKKAKGNNTEAPVQNKTNTQGKEQVANAPEQNAKVTCSLPDANASPQKTKDTTSSSVPDANACQQKAKDTGSGPNSVKKGPVNMREILDPKPVISDPFEAIRSQQEEAKQKQMKEKEDNHTTQGRSKSAGKRKQQRKQQQKATPKEKGNETKPASGKKRSSKGSREGAKSKDAVENVKNKNEKSRPKSGKKLRKHKKKGQGNVNIRDTDDLAKIAFVTGQGWYIETDCNENTNLKKAEKRFDRESDSSDTDHDFVQQERFRIKRASIDLSEHKYDDNLYWTSGSSSEEESDYDADYLPGMEIVQEEVVFSARDLAHGANEITLPGSKTITEHEQKEIQSIVTDKKQCNNSEPHISSAVSKTVKAINDFSKSVEDKQLDAMLAADAKQTGSKLSKPKFGGGAVKRSSSLNSSSPSLQKKTSVDPVSSRTPRRSVSSESINNADCSVMQTKNTSQNSAKQVPLSTSEQSKGKSAETKLTSSQNTTGGNKPASFSSSSNQPLNKSVTQSKNNVSFLSKDTKGNINSKSSKFPRRGVSEANTVKSPKVRELDSAIDPVTVRAVPDSPKGTKEPIVTGIDMTEDVKVGPVPESFENKSSNIKRKPTVAQFVNKQNTEGSKMKTEESNNNKIKIGSLNDIHARSGKQSKDRNRHRSDPSNEAPHTGRVRSARHSTGEDPEQDEEDIDSMINEILKNTPNPSLTLSFKNQGGQTSPDKHRTSPEEICQTLREKFDNDMDLKDSQRFQQVRVQEKTKEADGTESASSTLKEEDTYKTNPDLMKKIDAKHLDRFKSEGQEAMEKEGLQKLIASLQHMELRVDASAKKKKKKQFETPQVQALPDSSVSPNPQGRPPPVPTRVPPEEPAVEKSPRFVRKHDSLRESRMCTKDQEQDWDSMSDASLAHSEIGSDFLNNSLSSSIGRESISGGMVPKDGRVVTSRLGRCGASSSMSSSSISDDVETIQWKKGNMLGKGAFGTVWCGLTNAGELIAVKQIELNTNDMDRAEAEYEKIQEEVAILKTLKHKNIVSYLGTSLEENVVSIFMQFVPGGSIANILARFGALEEEVFCHYTKQILEGVEYLHSNEVIHRDIKGGNVMVMHNGEIKLIDFGCAKRLCLNVSVSQNRLLKSMRGTPYWMAPEVISETGHGTKSDIWSIGCTVFEMSTRKPPWADMPPMTAIFAIGSDKPVPTLPDKFSLEARDFVRRCLTRDQDKRPSATELLRHPFIMKRVRKKTSLS